MSWRLPDLEECGCCGMLYCDDQTDWYETECGDCHD